MPPTRAHIAMLAAVVCGAPACLAPAASAQVPAPPPMAPVIAPGTATLVTAPGVLRGKVARVRGALPDVGAGATVQIQRQDPAAGWVDEASATTDAAGAFIARWRPRFLGRFVLRALAGADAVRAAAAVPTAQLTVYRPVRASWYGPGLYGRKTACGQVLSHRLLGVAHRTLPCGARVEVYLGGRAVTVPVVDRGPFANGAHYDLTSATAQQLGLTETTTVGVVPQQPGATIPAPPAVPPGLAGTGGAPPAP